MNIQSIFRTNIKLTFTTLKSNKLVVVCGSHQLYMITLIIKIIYMETQTLRTCSGQLMIYYSKVMTHTAARWIQYVIQYMRIKIVNYNATLLGSNLNCTIGNGNQLF